MSEYRYSRIKKEVCGQAPALVDKKVIYIPRLNLLTNHEVKTLESGGIQTIKITLVGAGYLNIAKTNGIKLRDQLLLFSVSKVHWNRRVKAEKPDHSTILFVLIDSCID